MWEAVPPHHEEGEPGREGVRLICGGKWGDHAAAWAALPFPSAEQGCPSALCSSGTQHGDVQGSWHPWAGIVSDMCRTCLSGSSVTVLPCPRSVSGPCVTYVSPHTSPTPLKWTRRWGLP